MITELARVRSLVVRPSSVIARYQGQTRDPREIGQELNVSAVLTAGFIHSGEHFRVTAQLIDVASGELLWSDRIDTSAADIIAVQDTIAQRIVEGLRVGSVRRSRSASRRRRRRIPSLTSSICVAAICLRVSSSARCRATIATAPSNISTSAIQLDPNFALAHDGLGACYINRVFKGFGGAEDYERAKSLSKKHSQSIPTSSKHAC